MTPESIDMYDAVNAAIEGADLEEVVEMLAYMLADSVAQASEYVPDQEMFLEGGSLYSQAYQFVSTPDSMTLN